ncbi:MAG: tRNA pseudouridine(55) synthase TruB [Planctomycetota bacterium]
MKHGLVVIDKQAGESSAAALRPLKAEAGRKTKVGHAGTLDPFATGVLLALVGDATRLSDLAMALPKTYEAVVQFGWQTDTLDPEGEIVAETDPGEPRDLAAVLPAFLGEIEQQPPAYSALKVDGERAYRLARRGEAPELKARRVRVDAIDVLAVDWPHVTLRIRCGAGTYIRALARDIGAAFDLPASLTALRRTAIGPFAAEQAGSVQPPETITRAADVPEVALDAAAARRFVTGQLVADEGPDAIRLAVFVGERLAGLGERRNGRLRASTVLSQARADLEQRGV